MSLFTRPLRPALVLSLACLLAPLALLGCAALLGYKDTSFQNQAESLREQATFYEALLPAIEPRKTPAPAGPALVLGPTYAAALQSLTREGQAGQQDLEYAARGTVTECQLLAEVLRRRGLFSQVTFRESDTPAATALTEAGEQAAVIYMDPGARTWFFLPQNGGAADRIDLKMFLAHDRGEVRSWLAQIESALARPPLAKAAPPPPPQPAAPPPKRAAKVRKSTPKLMLPAPFGLLWRANLADLRRLKCRLKGRRPVGGLVEYLAVVTPQRPENTAEIHVGLHKLYGLQRIVWRGTPIGGDPYGFLGREQFFKMESLLKERYGPPANMEKFVAQTQQLDSGQFYTCLGQAGCGSWNSTWKTPELSVRLDLLPVQEAEGVLLITYQGPDWEKILQERQRHQEKTLEKAL